MKKNFRHSIPFLSLFTGVSLFAFLLYAFPSGAVDIVNPGQWGGLVNEVLGQLEQDIPNPACLDNYDELPRSQEYDATHNWNLSFIPFEPWTGTSRVNGTQPAYFDSPHPRREYFIDLDGDGLADYLYADHRSGEGGTLSRTSQECVYINNGHGWDVRYRCYSRVWLEIWVDEEGQRQSAIRQDYYGDCAAQ